MASEATQATRARDVLRAAQRAAGVAAYQYFFIDASPAARAAYVAAIEAESEADALVAAMVETDAAPAAAP